MFWNKIFHDIRNECTLIHKEPPVGLFSDSYWRKCQELRKLFWMCTIWEISQILENECLKISESPQNTFFDKVFKNLTLFYTEVWGREAESAHTNFKDSYLRN